MPNSSRGNGSLEEYDMDWFSMIEVLKGEL